MPVVLERHRYAWELVVRPDAVPVLRNEVCGAVWRLGRPRPFAQPERATFVAGVCSDAGVLVTELLSNVLAHCRERRCAVSVSLAGGGGAVRVGVRDFERRVPEMRRLDELHERGRGLRVINGLAARWGWVPRPGGKEVWFECDLGDHPG